MSEKQRNEIEAAAVELGLDEVELQFELGALRKSYTNLVIAGQYARDTGLKEIKVEIDGATFTVPAAPVDESPS